MAEPDLERWIDTLSAVLGLDVPTANRPGVKANLETALKMAAKLERKKLSDEAEPAPVYRP